MTRAFSGRDVDELTVSAAVDGSVGVDDVRIHPDALREQARVAAAHGNPQLAVNLRRAAELTAIDDGQLIEIYEALRPRRSTQDQLEALAERLDVVPAPLCAAMVREALAVYRERDLLA